MNTDTNLRGDIIEESLKDKAALRAVRVVSTRVEKVTAAHKTPWLKQWTLHTVEVPEKDADGVAETISHALLDNYWYVDFRNSSTHYIIFPDTVFKIDRSKPEQYKAAVAHGLKLGIPDYQLDFSPAIKEWERPNA
ncbi:MAG TPA: hypothetical protein VLH86_00225 [Patescibacteria group bacterium]|nr:hypothetical protein [Patescibacteria group bacterium]